MRYFLDTEFNGFGGDLISLALVREDGSYIYLATACPNPGPWVKQNVIPVIDAHPAMRIGRHEFGHYIAAFLREDRAPLIIADWPDDIRYFCQALITGPGQMVSIGDLQFVMRRVDAYPTTLARAVQHNAWWDAMALRHLLLER